MTSKKVLDLVEEVNSLPEKDRENIKNLTGVIVESEQKEKIDKAFPTIGGGLAKTAIADTEIKAGDLVYEDPELNRVSKKYNMDVSMEIVENGIVMDNIDPVPFAVILPEQQVLFSLEEMAVTNVSKVDQLKEVRAKQKEMIESVLLNDEVYRLHLEASKSADKIKKQTKAEIMSRPDMRSLDTKVKEASLEIREINESQNSYALEILRLSRGVDEIEKDGQKYRIVTKAKLVKSK